MMSFGQGCHASFTLPLSDEAEHVFDPMVTVEDGRGGKVEIKNPKPDRLQWKTLVGSPKERRFVRLGGVAGDIEISPFNNDLNTLQRAVCERVFFVKAAGGGFTHPPRPDEGVFAERLLETRQQLVGKLPRTAPVSHGQFVSSYEGRKRKVYQRALDELRAGRSKVEEDARIKAFVKFEKTDCTTKEDPVPRVISPRDPKYNVRVGRYLKPLEKRLFKSLDKLFGEPTVVKGYNVKRTAEILRSKWERYSDPVAVGLDASRFDQHVSEQALEWEHSIYLECFPQKKHKERLSRLLKHQLYNISKSYLPDGELSYAVKGTRMSGDMNTSMGNTLLMCAMNYAYLKHKGVNAGFVNNGDDCVVIMERRDLARYMDGLREWFLAMGFNMTVEESVDEFEQIEFCQTKPVFDGSEYIMVRNIKTALTKDSVMLSPWQGPALFRGWLDAVGTGGLSMTGGIPVFQSFYRCYQRSGLKRRIPKELLPWSFRHASLGMFRSYGPVLAVTRASFYLAFGITPDEQINLERYYDQLTIGWAPGDEVAHHPLLRCDL